MSTNIVDFPGRVVAGVNGEAPSAAQNLGVLQDLEVSPRIAELSHQRDAAYAEQRRLSDLGRPDDETDVPFDRWFDLSDEIVSIRAETFDDLVAQHRVIMHYYNLDGTGLNMGDAEERWVIGLGDSIRRLAGVS